MLLCLPNLIRVMDETRAAVLKRNQEEENNVDSVFDICMLETVSAL